LIKKCQAAGVETIYDIMELEDDKRTNLLKMSKENL
jgi:pre-mRNA-splicing helicase BRR2